MDSSYLDERVKELEGLFSVFGRIVLVYSMLESELILLAEQLSGNSGKRLGANQALGIIRKQENVKIIENVSDDKFVPVLGKGMEDILTPLRDSICHGIFKNIEVSDGEKSVVFLKKEKYNGEWEWFEQAFLIEHINEADEHLMSLARTTSNIRNALIAD